MMHAHSTPAYAANLKWLFTELPFLDRFAAAASQGFRGVEYASPYEYSPQVLRAKLQQEGLRQVLINTPAAPAGEEGENGFACIPGRQQRFRDGLRRALDYAQALDCALIHLQAGRLPGAKPCGGADATFHDNLAWAVDLLQGTGIRCVLECLNQTDTPGYFLRSLGHAADCIEPYPEDRLALLFDAYHCAMSGEDVGAEFDAVQSRVAHIQFADAPGRHEPGTGHIPWRVLLDRIAAADYRGWIGCEYRPRTNTVAGLDWRLNLSETD